MQTGENDGGHGMLREREMIAISDSSQEEDSVNQSVVECVEREQKVDLMLAWEEAQEAVKDVCNAVQELRLALSHTLDQFEAALDMPWTHCRRMGCLRRVLYYDT